MTALEVREKINAFPKDVVVGALWAFAMSYGASESILKFLEDANKSHQKLNRELAPMRKLNRELAKANKEAERILARHRGGKDEPTTSN